MIRRIVRGFGELLITCGLIVLLFASYEVYGKAFEINAAQNELDSALDHDWGPEPTVPPKPGAALPALKPIPGKGIARLYIPRLDKHLVVVEGVKPRDIAHAPGHYPESQLPGQTGNFAVAGHRVPSVFWDLDKMSNGDAIVVETRSGWYVYRVDKKHIVNPHDVGVVAKNPNKPGAPTTAKYLTLTTCNPKWDNYERLIIRAVFVRQQARAAGRPAELGGA
jgi:sortase A